MFLYVPGTIKCPVCSLKHRQESGAVIPPKTLPLVLVISNGSVAQFFP